MDDVEHSGGLKIFESNHKFREKKHWCKNVRVAVKILRPCREKNYKKNLPPVRNFERLNLHGINRLDSKKLKENFY